MIVQEAPITIISPPSTKIEKLTFSSPKSQRLIGSTNQSDERQTRAGVHAPAPASRASSQERDEAEDHERDAEAEHDRVLRADAGDHERRARRAAPALPGPAALAALLLGRLGQVADRGDDVHPAHAPAEKATTTSVSRTPIA